MAHLGDRARRDARHFFSPLSFGSVQVRQHSQRLAGGRPGPRGFLAGRDPDSSPARACLVAAGIVGEQCGHWVWGSRARASAQHVRANRTTRCSSPGISFELPSPAASPRENKACMGKRWGKLLPGRCLEMFLGQIAPSP